MAPTLEAIQAVIGAPLYGQAVPVAHGAAAGLILVAERRSLAWLSGRVEAEVQDVLVERLGPGAMFVDVGASVGFFSLLAARLVGPGGVVVAFEPQPDAASSLRRNAQLNGFSMVEVVEAALSSWTGKGALAGIGKATAHIVDGREPEAQSVEVTTLDESLAGRSEPPVVVKIDVEGGSATCSPAWRGCSSRTRRSSSSKPTVRWPRSAPTSRAAATRRARSEHRTSSAFLPDAR